MTLSPDISIIIPAYNNPEKLDRCLKSLQQSELRDQTETIVIDDCSRENGKAITDIAYKYNVRFYRQDRNAGPGVARNRGAEMAKGDILVFLDSDCVAPEGWLSNLIKPIQDGRSMATTACYSGPVIPGWITTFQDEDYRYRMPSAERDTSFVNSCNFAINHKLFMDCGGFPSQRISEDMVFGLMLADNGTPARFLTDAGVKHDYHNDIRSYLRQRFSFAYNTVKSYLDRNKLRSIKANSSERSFNPVRTASGMFFITIALVSFISAIFFSLLRSDVALLLIAGGLVSLIAEACVHGRFLLFLSRRLGLGRTLSYLFLLYLIDFVYAYAVLNATAVYCLGRD